MAFVLVCRPAATHTRERTHTHTNTHTQVVVYKGSKETRKELFKSRIKKPGIKVRLECREARVSRFALRLECRVWP